MNAVAADPVHRPSLALLGAEPFRAANELARHRLLRSTSRGSGDGHPVVIFPGLGADGSSVATLCDHCRSQGYSRLVIEERSICKSERMSCDCRTSSGNNRILPLEN